MGATRDSADAVFEATKEASCRNGGARGAAAISYACGVAGTQNFAVMPTPICRVSAMASEMPTVPLCVYML